MQMTTREGGRERERKKERKRETRRGRATKAQRRQD
jgi:hypothetical protein